VNDNLFPKLLGSKALYGFENHIPPGLEAALGIGGFE
jgi:hypothetical protein